MVINDQSRFLSYLLKICNWYYFLSVMTWALGMGVHNKVTLKLSKSFIGPEDMTFEGAVKMALLH